MDKETLIQNLKAKVGENDFAVLSAQTIDGIVTPLLGMFSDDTKVTDATYELPVAVLKNYIGQYRHDVAAGITSGIEGEKTRLNGEKDAAIAAFKEQWEKEHPAPAGNAAGTAAAPAGNTAVTTAEDMEKKVNDLLDAKLSELMGEKGAIGSMKANLSTIGDFIKSFRAQQEKDAIASLGKQLEDHITERSGGPLTTEERNALEVAMMGFDIKADSKLDDLKKPFGERYEAIYKKLYPNGGMPFGNANGEGGEKSGFEAFMEKRTAAEKQNAMEMAEVVKSFV